MKESIGTTYLFQIVIVFILLFTAYLCLSINYSRSYAVKNTIVNTIQREKGWNETGKLKIKAYLNKVGFKSIGKCPEDYMAYDVNGTEQGIAGNGVYCVREVETIAKHEDLPRRKYYKVVVFYKLDLPIFGSMFSFKNTGETYQMGDPNQG